MTTDWPHMNHDTLHRILFQNAPVKGELVQLPSTWQCLLSTNRKRHYPVVVERLLGEMLAASVLLSANLKFDGSLIMQIHGDGPIQLLVTECRADLTVRAMAKLRDDAVCNDDLTLKQLINVNNQARFAITLDPNDKQPGQQPYQGIVPLEGDTIAEVLMHYMRTSEQLDTHIQLASSHESCAGLLLQKLPLHGGNNTDENAHTWDELNHIALTLSNEELLNTPSETILHQLFWQYPIEQHTTQDCQFGCTCSPAKVSNMLTMLGEEEALSMVEQAQVEVACDFCGQEYILSEAQVRQLFTTPNAAHNASQQLH
ncbi:Hsp33 family molecular chaperone HslO [Hydromonas duriensis]|uniref:Molecular chaperone Hsp33 n=1 Tax=Hydromonas duriensis TaxID=1527608 RepID=A0A4R6Y8B0_9BURK|nr:Hsp33 family molecular chaperone HslO [Hydromonas duriensis]TDR31639.1 molecular chaperone Hsp33 [Hydromonas duriensis]